MVSWINRRRRIVERIFLTLVEAAKKGVELDKEKLIYEVCAVEYCARRTAIEYIKSAQYNFENQKWN